MSTPAQVRSSWATNLWVKTAMTDITTNIFDYEPSIQSVEDFSDLLVEGTIDYITYLTLREPKEVHTRQIVYGYQVLVARYLESDDNQNAGDAYNQVVDDLITIEDTIRNDATFNKGWGSVVDYWVLVENRPVENLQLSNRNVWVGRSLYEGRKIINF